MSPPDACVLLIDDSVPTCTPHRPCSSFQVHVSLFLSLLWFIFCICDDFPLCSDLSQLISLLYFLLLGLITFLLLCVFDLLSLLSTFCCSYVELASGFSYYMFNEGGSYLNKHSDGGCGSSWNVWTSVQKIWNIQPEHSDHSIHLSQVDVNVLHQCVCLWVCAHVYLPRCPTFCLAVFEVK